MGGMYFDRLTKVMAEKRGTNQQEEWKKMEDGEKYDVEVMKSTLRSVLSELESMVYKSKSNQASHGRPPLEHDHSALNIVITDGSSLVAIRYASPPPREPPSLYYSTKAGATLNRKYEGHPDKGHPELEKKGVELQEGKKDKGQHGKHVIGESIPFRDCVPVCEIDMTVEVASD